MALKGILEEWNPWWVTGEVPSSLKGVERHATREILPWMGKRPIKVLLGPRRAGKTTVMYQLIAHLLKRLPPRAIAYLNFEDPELRERPFRELYREVRALMGGRGVLLMDEVQSLPNWEGHVRAIHDRRDGVELVLSGSTLAMVGKAFAEKLGGRTVTFSIYPFSFMEAMELRGLSADPRDMDAVRGLLEEVLTFGTYPEVFLSTDPIEKKRLLLEYYESIVARDVVAAHGLELGKAEEMAAYLLRNASRPLSINKLSKLFGMAFHTTERYVKAFQEAMVLFEVRAFSHSLKEQLSRPRKLYPIDTGLLWAVGRSSPDRGRLFEMLVGAELHKLGAELHYWRGKRECDFIVGKHGSPLMAIQVTWRLDGNRERELAGLREAMAALRIREGELITAEDVVGFLNLLTKIAKVFKGQSALAGLRGTGL